MRFVAAVLSMRVLLSLTAGVCVARYHGWQQLAGVLATGMNIQNKFTAGVPLAERQLGMLPTSRNVRRFYWDPKAPSRPPARPRLAATAAAAAAVHRKPASTPDWQKCRLLDV